MLLENWLYFFGLGLVILYIITGFDDFIWDIATVIRRKGYNHQLADLKLLDNQPPKLLAIAIAAWHEENVLGDVINNMIDSMHYPSSMYHVFLGVYPNDSKTIAVAKELAENFQNVHIVINELPGPTSKAQNINYIIKYIKAFEEERNWRFASLTVHDSEDVIHPYELKVTNYLLEKYQAIQFPVFPLMEFPKFHNFFRNIVTNTYADEFAENHFSVMVSRYSIGAFVPSAGTGFALSREILEQFEDGKVLPEDSLTEDYRLSLTLYQKGIQMYYVLLSVPRINQEQKIVTEFIATRSRFPYTFKAAIKQKTRWILGITMQSFRISEIFKGNKMSFSGRYSMYRDYKAKVGNLLVFLGYPILIYFISSFFIDLPPVYPKYSLSWYLAVIVTLMMIERQIFRGIAIYKVYGLRSVFFACLFPPLLPIRFIVGNLINLIATIKAYIQNIFGNQKKIKEKNKQNKSIVLKKVTSKKELVWDKTEHHFLPKTVLQRYYRKFGDVILEKKIIDPRELNKLLTHAQNSKMSIGSYLLREGLITEELLIEVLGKVNNKIFIISETLPYYPIASFKDKFNEEFLREQYTIPILTFDGTFVFAVSEDSPSDALEKIATKYQLDIIGAYATKNFIIKGLEQLCEADNSNYFESSAIYPYFQMNQISYSQYVLIHNYISKTNRNEKILIQEMGLLFEDADS